MMLIVDSLYMRGAIAFYNWFDGTAAIFWFHGRSQPHHKASSLRPDYTTPSCPRHMVHSGLSLDVQEERLFFR